MRVSKILVLLVTAAALGGAIALRSPNQNPAKKGQSRSSYTAAAEADRVKALPGAPSLDFGLFSGYIVVDEAAGRALHYVYAEAKAAAAEAPVVLWLNGGPGCSSLGGGFMSELGPFFPKKDGTGLTANPYAWNQLANMLWLESPAFVGFSTSNDTRDAIVGDARTAADSRAFLLGWLERFPQHAAADLYLSGESYAGHYVPQLAWEIVRGNQRWRQSPAAAAAAAAGEGGVGAPASAAEEGRAGAGTAAEGYINLKGLLVGNAWTDPAIDNEGTLDFWYTHAMVSAESRKGIKATCDFRTIGPLLRGKEAITLPDAVSTARAAGTVHPAAQPSSSSSSGVQQGAKDRKGCDEYLQEAMDQIAGINIYEIYADVCMRPAPSVARPVGAAVGSSQQDMDCRYHGALLGSTCTPRAAPATTQHQQQQGGGILAGVLRWMQHIRQRLGAGSSSSSSSIVGGGVGLPGRIPKYNPCVDGAVETYLNLPEVQAALHVNTSGNLPGPWTDCTSRIMYSREDLLTSVLPTWRHLLTTDLKLWVYSGDVDGIVPVLGTRRWVEGLGLPVTGPWRAWASTTGQVAGWVIDYQGLTLATVRNAGHMVPYVQPERAYHLLGMFLFGKDAGTRQQEL